MNQAVLLLLIIALTLIPSSLEAAGPPENSSPAEPDTIVYHSFFENPDQPIYILSGLVRYWVTVRFTPVRAFTIHEIYFLVENITSSQDPCFVYIALDSDGQPDPDGILAGPIRIPGPLPNAEMITVGLESEVAVDSLQDFHVMVSSGGGMSYSVGLEIPADYPERTGRSARSNAGPFFEYVFPTPADAIIAVGGVYEEPRDVDLATTCLSNGVDLFFPGSLATEGLSLTSVITNSGSDSALEYSFSWTVRDEHGDSFLLYDTVPPPIPPGGSLSVTCPRPWIASSDGGYVITDSIFCEEDRDPTNDVSRLEQLVSTGASALFLYDDGMPDGWYQVGDGTTLAVRFASWARIASIDSLSVSFNGPSSCAVSVLDGFFTDGVPLEPLFAGADTTFPGGWTTIALPESISPTRSTFFVAVTGSGQAAFLDIDLDPPLTAVTCLPPQFLRRTNGMPTWQPIMMADPLIRVFATTEESPAERQVEILACRVEPATVLKGGSLEVKVYWEFFDKWGGGPLDFTLTAGLVDYPPFELLTWNMIDLAAVEPDIYVDSMTFQLGAGFPAGTQGYAGALIESAPPASLADTLQGEGFKVVYPKEATRGKF